MVETMKALVTDSNKAGIVTHVPVPKAGPNEIRVKVHSIALNPVDSLYAYNLVDAPGRVIGSDIAGTVDHVGEGVTRWKKGDRVAGLLQGATSGNPRPGGFATYAILEEDLTIGIPEDVSFDEAATFPLCSLTAAQALFIRLELNPPFPNNPFGQFPAPKSDSPVILVYAAATSLGMFTVQLAKLLRTPSGKQFTVLATASPKNFDKIRKLGANAVYDYKDPSWPEELKKNFGGVDYALDCISEGDTTGIVSSTFKNGGGNLAVIRKDSWDASKVRKDVNALYGGAWFGLGHEILYNGTTFPANPEWRGLTVEFYKWLSAGSPQNPKRFPIEANLVRLMPGGLERVPLDGFVLLGGGGMKDRKSEQRKEPHMRPISGEKLVYRVDGDV